MKCVLIVDVHRRKKECSAKRRLNKSVHDHIKIQIDVCCKHDSFIQKVQVSDAIQIPYGIMYVFMYTQCNSNALQIRWLKDAFSK